MRCLLFTICLLAGCGASHPRANEDIDHDGISDDHDPCVRPGTDGCAQSTSSAMDGDRDGDGIPDRADECPNDPSNNPNGCPARDPDGAG